ncbi:hypothetical protein [Hymenobacter sp. GOD-10R]|uniref:hypothetical protein n=1 Tax=Hymenobacter sp. GOD-10R TaxID=3093922 RepID=UPI002D79C7AC|nr:hypothetical protein [Hymenobacter sp. GOD-10R]WRQ29127.1 hypothetical protein SD425_02475 [Hymenobacter sp. GOD-10R]
MNYQGRIAVSYRDELILGNVTATLTVQEQGPTKSWSVFTFHEFIDQYPLSIAQRDRGVVELTFVRDNGEEYSGQAFVSNIGIGAAGVEVYFTGTGRLNGYKES